MKVVIWEQGAEKIGKVRREQLQYIYLNWTPPFSFIIH